jgi:hypothetical protein
MRSLDLSYDGCGVEIADAVAATSMTRLESLELGGNPLGDEGARRIARARLPSLRRLSLFNCRLGPDAYRALLDAPELPELREVDIGFGNQPIPPALREAFDRRYPRGRRP